MRASYTALTHAPQWGGTGYPAKALKRALNALVRFMFRLFYVQTRISTKSGRVCCACTKVVGLLRAPKASISKSN